MCEFAAGRAGIAKAFEGGSDLFAREARVVLHAGGPVERPLQCFDELARQTKWQIKAADPLAICFQPFAKVME